MVAHANIKELGLTPLFGDRRGVMPPQLKQTKQLFKVGYFLTSTYLIEIDPLFIPSTIENLHFPFACSLNDFCWQIKIVIFF